MKPEGSELPDIVVYKIPRIEVYWVTDDQLARIEEGSGRVAQDLSFALAAGSIFGTLVVALLTGTFPPSIGTALTIAALVFAIVAIYTGLRWWRERNSADNVIAAIRRRKVDPEPSP